MDGSTGAAGFYIAVLRGMPVLMLLMMMYYVVFARTEIEADIIERDHRDMTREISPLKQADDAVLVDTSDMNIEEVTQALMKIVEEKCG